MQLTVDLESFNTAKKKNLCLTFHWKNIVKGYDQIHRWYQFSQALFRILFSLIL